MKVGNIKAFYAYMTGGFLQDTTHITRDARIKAEHIQPSFAALEGTQDTLLNGARTELQIDK